MARVVIVGAALAGTRTAQALRTSGFDGEIVVLGAEPHPPYDRPPLSKSFLRTAPTGRTDLDLLDSQSWKSAEIDLRLGTAAVGLDVAAQRVRTEQTGIDYDVCVVATGAAARTTGWSPSSHVFSLRTVDDALKLRTRLARGVRLAVVGAGFIGSEVASTAREIGCEVTVIDPMPVPLYRSLGPDVGAVLAPLPQRFGVETRLGVGVDAIRDSRRSAELVLTDGSCLEVDIVVAGIGAVPNDAWLTGSGLAVADGVVCDRFCRAVGREDIFAVGDVARYPHPVSGQLVRSEHWTNAIEQATVVAHNIVNPDDLSAYRPTDYVWSDQYGVKLQLSGDVAGSAYHEVVGTLDFAGEQLGAAILCADAEDRLIGSVTVNRPRVSVQVRRMIAQGMPFASALESVRESCGERTVV
ncbi:NAD(P)/FAD-dependent oxidoreductase [Nocardia sp. CA-290969]|uniref:NAD(P)/FAD-dependent oxidoreductase n=1 Tax=Nocardia sp. CA-290969 TaxID=3239986 RepID=UPI003D8B7BB2